MADDIDKAIKGLSGLRVVHCEGARESLVEALSHVPSNRKASMERSIIFLINRLVDGHPMSRSTFPKEGELPKSKGKDNGHFYAFKKIPIRGYVWLSKRYPGTYFISHYVYKDYDDLKKQDTERVGNNWKRIEENEDER